MIDILNRWTGVVIYHSETAQNIAEAVSECQEQARRDGKQAKLSWADLREANLSGANLSKADLSWADLSKAKLSKANLSGADLRGANLSGANLSKADLSWADLRGANLSGANLSKADLSGANLSGADLSWADLSGGPLDPQAELRAYTDEEIVSRGLEIRGNQIWGWRTAKSQHVGSTEYIPRKETYSAPFFSVCTKTECHPGIYIAGKAWLSNAYPGVPIVRCYCLRREFLIAGDKSRCKRLWVVTEDAA